MSAQKQTTVLSHTLFCHAWNADRSSLFNYLLDFKMY